jgi:hypothetical protein
MKKSASPLPLDFRLTISPLFDEREQKYKTRMVLETSRSFASFVYDLSVKETLTEHQIHWKVNGLKPPRLSIPASGRARFERIFDALRGEYEMTIEGIDGNTTTFEFKFSSQLIQLVKPPGNTFVELHLNTTITSST